MWPKKIPFARKTLKVVDVSRLCEKTVKPLNTKLDLIFNFLQVLCVLYNVSFTASQKYN